MKMRTQLGNVRGLGSAKSGTGHFWMQRLTAIALIPLTLWFVAALASMGSVGYAEAVEWVKSPITAVLLLALIAAMWLCFHEMMTALTAEGSGVLDKLDTSGGSWQARMHRALVGKHAELDLSNCGMGATAARAVADDLPKL